MGDDRKALKPSKVEYGATTSDNAVLLQDVSPGDDLEGGKSGGEREVKVGCEPLRLAILCCICALTFGSYWVFDTPGAIPNKMKSYFENGHKTLSHSEILSFYSAYSWPNTVLALFGGIILDQITGLRVGCLLFCGLVFIGQTMFATGIILRSFPLAVVGRFVFGLGGESLTVAQNSFTVKWFEGGDYLALAFGTVVSFARVGSSVNFAVTPTLSNIGVPFALLFGTGACGLSLLTCLTLSALDKWATKNRPNMLFKDPTVVTPTASLTAAEVIKQVKMITFPAWVLNFICMFFYVGVLTFNTVASDIMQHTGKHYSESRATLFLSIPNFVSVFASPLFGLMVDKKGRALVFISVASCMMIVSMLVFLGNATEKIHINPIPLMIWQGLGYALGAAAIWPSLARVVAPEICSTAYGMMTSVQNFGMAVFPQIIGSLQSSVLKGKTKYYVPIMIFVACEAAALGLTIMLVGVDRRMTGGRLNATAAEREVLENAEKSKAEEEKRRLEVAQRQAKDKQEALRRAAASQAVLLERDIGTNRQMYYARLNVRMPPSRRNSFIYRAAHI